MKSGKKLGSNCMCGKHSQFFPHVLNRVQLSCQEFFHKTHRRYPSACAMNDSITIVWPQLIWSLSTILSVPCIIIAIIMSSSIMNVRNPTMQLSFSLATSPLFSSIGETFSKGKCMESTMLGFPYKKSASLGLELGLVLQGTYINVLCHKPGSVVSLLASASYDTKTGWNGLQTA